MKTRRMISRAVERLDYLSGEDPINAFLHKKRYEIAETYCINDSQILDLGCGLGWGTNYLSKKGIVTGVDIDRKSIIETKKRYFFNKKIKFILSKGDKLPFSNNKFDAVICMETIEHLQHGNFILSEISRVLKKNGIIIISTPNKNHFGRKLKKLFGLKIFENPYHLHEYEENEMCRLLNKYGFKVLKIKRFLLCLPVTILHLIQNSETLVRFFSFFTWKYFSTYFLVFAKKNAKFD